MEKRSLDKTLTEYYDERALPESSLRRLSSMTGSPASDDAGRLREWSVRFALAASVALIAFGLGYARPWNDPAPGPMTPDLVAVQIHADWCVRTPVVGPMFRELSSSYGNRPVLFVTLDITDDTSAMQSRLLAENLGIDHVYDQPFESGMIKLVDRRSGTVLATATEEGETSEMIGMLAGLPQASDETDAATGG